MTQGLNSYKGVIGCRCVFGWWCKCSNACLAWMHLLGKCEMKGRGLKWNEGKEECPGEKEKMDCMSVWEIEMWEDGEGRRGGRIWHGGGGKQNVWRRWSGREKESIGKERVIQGWRGADGDEGFGRVAKPLGGKKKDKTLWIHCMKRQGIMQKDREAEGSGNRKWGKGPWVLVEREKTSGSVKKGTDWKRLERK